MRSDETNVAHAVMSSILGDQAGADKYVNRELLKQAVMRQVMCECGAILDCRRDVLVYVSNANHDIVAAVVLCHACADKKMPTYRALAAHPGQIYSFTIIDGRELHSRK
jgi:hypothetical protein